MSLILQIFVLSRVIFDKHEFIMIQAATVVTVDSLHEIQMQHHHLVVIC